jgi:UDP-N-acetylmuramyl pentapeptide phosphotransferase/UDP-N-acetylglucosamine-1-phosphate transferase
MMTGLSLAVPAAALVATLAATPRVLGWLERRAILDRPVDRSAHRSPVPRGGGLAVIPVLITAWLGLAVAGWAPRGAAPVALIGGALALLSWLDDLRNLPVGVRLCGQFLAVLAGLFFLRSAAVFQDLLPPLLADVAAALLWLWFVNLFNFMDGIDGITGIETAAIGVGLPLAQALGGLADDGSAALALSAAAGAIAFLRWNWHPAKLFLGDVGSVPLGYLLGFLLLTLAARGLWAPALILPLYYLADASLTLAARVLRGERFWMAHRRHFYQRALGAEGDHAAVARLVLGGDAALVLCALCAVYRPLWALALAMVVVAGMLALMQRRARPPA